MKKKLAVLLAAAMMMGAMTGCGSSAKTETTEAETKAEETTEAAENEDKFQSSILFCGSTSLYPIMSSLASSFTEKYVTWDKVDPSFSAENISIYVAPGGSGVGVSAAIGPYRRFRYAGKSHQGFRGGGPWRRLSGFHRGKRCPDRIRERRKPGM